MALALLPLLAMTVVWTLLAKDPPRRQAPSNLNTVLQSGDFWLLCFIYSVTFGGFVGLTTFLPLFLHGEYKLSAIEAGNVIAVAAFLGIRVDLAPRPATSTGVLAALGNDLRGRRVVVQLAGPEPSPLTTGMRAAGAAVAGVCIYRYPPDAAVGSADSLVEAIANGELDAVTFTSAPAVEGLVAASVQVGGWPGVRRRLNAMIVAAVGPVTADALARHAVAVHVQPAEPRMGPMMRELAALAAARER